MNYYFTLLLVLAVHLTGPYLAALVSLGLVIFVGNLFFVRWAMKQMRVEPGDDLEGETNSGVSNAIGDTPIRTTVGVPRNRSLRPRDPAAERAEAADETVVPRKDYAGTPASASLPNEASRGGGRAGFEPLMPFSPATASVAASANPLPSSKTAEPQPSESLIALAAAPAAPAVAPRGADSLNLPPLSSDETKRVESKAEESSKPADLETASMASADLSLVDNETGKEEALPQPPPVAEPVSSPAPAVELSKPADTIPDSGLALPEVKAAAASTPVSTPSPEGESQLAPLSLPPLEPLALDIEPDEVKKSKSLQASTKTPEGALLAHPIEAEIKPVENAATPELTGLILPALVPTRESEPEKKPVEPENIAKMVEPEPAPVPLLPVLEPTAPSVVEEPPKPAGRSRIFLPSNLEEVIPPKPLVIESAPPSDPVSSDVAPVVPSDASALAKIDEVGDEKPVEQLPSVAPLSAVELPAEVSTPSVAHELPSEVEPVAHPVIIHLEEERQEALQSVAQEVAPSGRKPFMSRGADLTKETHVEPSVTADEPALSPLSAYPLGELTVIPPSETKEEPEAHMVVPVLPDLTEDVGHLTAKVSEPEALPHQPAEMPEHFTETPVGSLVEIAPPSTSVVNEPEKAHLSEHPEIVSDVIAVEPASSPTPVTDEPEPAHAEIMSPSEPVKLEDEHAEALPTTSGLAKLEEEHAVTFNPNPGLSPVDAEHIHGATAEPESLRDDSPHDFPMQLSSLESAGELVVPEPKAEEPSQPVMEQKEPAPEPATFVEDKPVQPETADRVSAASAGEEVFIPALAHEETSVSHSESPSLIPPQAAVAPAEDAPITTPRSYMTSTDSMTSQPAAGRASAQLTLGFEVTALQLTPFFKLGAVQLRPLSNIVSLHLLTAQQAENPLAAGISFQIETVDLDEHSHIRSILLKPLPQAQAAATPQPKLQVDNVQLGQTTEGAPIQVTSSQGTSTAVQLLATCTIAAMDFTPAFEIGSLRLEPNSNFVLLRSAPSQRPAALDLPPSFEVANVQLEGQAQIASVRLTPSTAK